MSLTITHPDHPAGVIEHSGLTFTDGVAEIESLDDEAREPLLANGFTIEGENSPTQEQLDAEKAEAERKATEDAEREKAEAEKAAADKAEAERLAAEKADAEKAEAAKKQPAKK